MALRDVDARYEFSVLGVKIWPLNADFSTTLPLNEGNLSSLVAIGGVGPFDFSGVSTPAAVPMTVKIDNGTPETQTIDISGAGSQSAVTATELAAAIEAANAAAGFVGVTATVTNSRIQIAVDTVTTQKYIQVYGEAARIGEFGQGAGLQAIILNTQQSVSVDPTQQDSETIEVVDSNGKTTSIITDSFRNGFTGTLTDTSIDLALRAILTGGTLSESGTFYSVPNSESIAKYFAMEMVKSIYSRGTNKEQDLVGYFMHRFYTAVASRGGDAGDRTFQNQVYNITGTEYKDSAGNIYGDSTIQSYTVAQYQTLDWFNI